ncbi:MAG: phosphate ABC transporter substrate-binding protein [Gammaproteobacteria bacterium]|nr:phosphate ABC transporter substrate-binding protein [Gammaproteobacteria bacterium]
MGSIQAKEIIQWTGCGISKKAFMSELAKAYTKKSGVEIKLSGGGATKGIRQAANGTVHIGGACRVIIPNSDEERNAFQIPVAWDALVVFVNKKNPVDNISFKQLHEVYSGKITNWKQLGGNDAPIELYVRRGKLSGVGRTIRELVFANYDQEFKATYVVKSSGPVEKGVLKNVNGLGISGYSSAKKRDLKLLKLDGKAPNYDNIKNGSYALYRPLYLVIKRGNKVPLVRDFVKYAVSKEGQDIIRSQGTVPYAEAIHLVMKQLDQYDRASAEGLYKSKAK